MELSVALQDYLTRREQSGYAQSSVTHARLSLVRFVRFLLKSDVRRPSCITEEILVRYLLHLRSARNKRDGEPLRAGAVESIFSAARGFVRHLALEGLILFDCSKSITVRRERRHAPASLTEMQTERILGGPDTETLPGIQDRAVLELLYSTAVRRSELCGLTVHDVIQGAVIVRQGKGGKDRIVPAGERALFWTARHLAESRPLLLRGKEHDTLFVNRHGGPLRPLALNRIVRDYMDRAGIKIRGNCHLFRHAAATHMMERGADLRYIQEILGHTDIRTTEIYTHVSSKHLKETLIRSHPAWHRETGTAPAPVRSVRTAEAPRGPGRTSGPVPEWAAGHVGRYLEERAALGKSTAAIRSKLGDFSRFCDEHAVRDVRMIGPETILEYTAYRQDFSPVTRYTAVVYIRGFLDFLRRKGVILTNPADRIRMKSPGARLPARVFSPDEMERILSVPDTQTAAGLRNRALLEMLYATGMRRLELVQLKVADLNTESRTIHIRDVKGGRDRTLPLPQAGFVWISAYVTDVRPRLAGLDDDGTLFLSSTGRAFNPCALGTAVRGILVRAGIEGGGSLHVFRHTAATLLLEGGADIRAVQESLGHRRISSTQIYTHVSIRRLKDVHAKTHPAEIRYRRRRAFMEDGADAEPDRQSGGETGA